MNQAAVQPRLTMRDITKRFGPVRALEGVDLVVGASEVHGLLGGNGAGKTTMMNILYGLYRADAGSIEIDGQPVVIDAPKDAIRHRGRADYDPAANKARK